MQQVTEASNKSQSNILDKGPGGPKSSSDETRIGASTRCDMLITGQRKGE